MSFKLTLRHIIAGEFLFKLALIADFVFNIIIILGE